MCEWLGEKPCGHSVEAVAQHLQFVFLVEVMVEVCVKCLAFHPFHHYDGKLLYVALCRVNEELIFQITQREYIRRGNYLQFICYLAVAFITILLILYEALDCIQLAVALIPHLEDDSEVTA